LLSATSKNLLLRRRKKTRKIIPKKFGGFRIMMYFCTRNQALRISAYAARFAAYSDERLKQTVDHERKVRGWGSERSYFLAALRGECEKRGIDYC